MNFLEKAQTMQAELTSLYHYFHRFPEPSHFEVETNKRIRQELDALSIPYLAPAPNITIGILKGGRPGKTVGLRIDTDALQMQEDTGLPFQSEKPGLMHGCGHDGHIAMGITAAKMLSSVKEELSGTVKFIFQPAEEGERGAQEVIATGLVQDIDCFFGIHLWSDYPTGTLHISPGPVCASADMFTIRITGKGGHGAYPHLCIDAVTAGAAVVEALQHIPSRFISPMQPVVVTVGCFHAGTRCNIIAQEAELRGTLRTFDNAVCTEVHQLLERLTKQTAAAHGCTAEVEIYKACSVVVNDAALCASAVKSAEKLMNKENISTQSPSMVGDDFAEYGALGPAVYAQLGIGSAEKGTCYAHHHGKFKLDEEMLPLGAALFCQFAYDTCEESTN